MCQEVRGLGISTYADARVFDIGQRRRGILTLLEDVIGDAATLLHVPLVEALRGAILARSSHGQAGQAEERPNLSGEHGRFWRCYWSSVRNLSTRAKFLETDAKDETAETVKSTESWDTGFCSVFIGSILSTECCGPVCPRLEPPAKTSNHSSFFGYLDPSRLARDCVLPLQEGMSVDDAGILAPCQR